MDHVDFEAALKNAESASFRQTVEYDFHFALDLILRFDMNVEVSFRSSICFLYAP
jgi:hypothetical protein